MDKFYKLKLQTYLIERLERLDKEEGTSENLVKFFADWLKEEELALVPTVEL